jgi:DNA polymerase lambda
MPSLRITVCGSFRRGKQSCGDVDFLLGPPAGSPHCGEVLCDLIDRLERIGFLTDHLAKPRRGRPERRGSYMGVCRLGPHKPHRRIDIKAYPAHQHPFALLYFTGSDHFNRSMRLYAKKEKGVRTTAISTCFTSLRSDVLLSKHPFCLGT